MDYTLIRSRRQTLAVSVGTDGKVIVRAPLRMPVSRIEAFLAEKSSWIESHTQSAGDAGRRRAERLSQPPRELPFLGGMCPVVNGRPYGYKDGVFTLPEGRTLEELIPCLRKIYSGIAKEPLISRTQLLADRMGVTISSVKINSAKTRWGSCSSKGSVNLSWKLILADPQLIDYVIIHELCHTRHMDHSAAFWEEVAAVIPDYARRRESLKEVQKLLTEYGLD